MNYDDNLDPVTRYLMTYIDSVERGEPAPDPGQLSPADRAEVDDLITGFGDFSAEVDVAIPPIEESRFAIEHGIVESPPWICVHGAALRREREAAGLSPSDLAAALTALGATTDEARVEQIENCESTLISPREARRLAAALGVSVGRIEASSEPWPATEREGLDDISSNHKAVNVGGHLAFPLEGGFLAGVVRCRGEAEDLNSLTFRRTAGTLLHGEWSQMHAAVLVSVSDPVKVLVVDPFDCEPRFSAPSGSFGYGSIEDAADLDEAMEDFNARFGIAWTDPPAFFANSGEASGFGRVDAVRVEEAVGRIRKSLNRYAEPKQLGCRLAIERLADTDLDRVVEELAETDGDQAAAALTRIVSTT